MEISIIETPDSCAGIMHVTPPLSGESHFKKLLSKETKTSVDNSGVKRIEIFFSDFDWITFGTIFSIKSFSHETEKKNKKNVV